MASNGLLPASELAPIAGGLLLRKDAAAAFNAMNAEARRRGLGSIGVRDAYRPLGAPGDLARGRWSQWAAWERYQHGGNLAAQPGTSNHGYGLAIDLASTTDRSHVDQVGGPFGFSKSWSDAQSEWWHLLFDSAHLSVRVNSGESLPLHLGANGRKVKTVQVWLGRAGLLNHRYADGVYGPRTAGQVKAFQHRAGLTADGVVGQHTWNALWRRYAWQFWHRKKGKK